MTDRLTISRGRENRHRRTVVQQVIDRNRSSCDGCRSWIVKQHSFRRWKHPSLHGLCAIAPPPTPIEDSEAFQLCAYPAPAIWLETMNFSNDRS
jgi:hypothetical protein